MKKYKIDSTSTIYSIKYAKNRILTKFGEQQGTLGKTKKKTQKQLKIGFEL